MRSRIMNAPKAQILLYGFGSEDADKFRSCAQPLKIGINELPHNCACEKVGYLAGFSGFSSCGEKLVRDGRCVIFSCIDGKQLNKVLDSMRASGLGNIPLKAAVTACNQKMTLTELMDELEKEHKKLHPEEN